MIKFFKDAVSEIHNVTWPTKKHYMHISMVAIVFTLSTAVFVGFLDYFFDKGVKMTAPVVEIESQIPAEDINLDVSNIEVNTENGETAEVEITEE